MEAFVIILFLFCFTIIPYHAAVADDTMAVNQTIKDGQTIVSPKQTFELGFFSPGNASGNRYLGIWYKRLATGTVAWVANRITPIKNNTGELSLHPNGVLVLRDSATNQVVWSSTVEKKGPQMSPVARLLDSGNFMVTDEDHGPEKYLWQSFDYPGDTEVPGMKIGRDLERGIVTNVTSWTSPDNPSPGPFMVYMDFSGLPQIFHKEKDVIDYRLGSWNGVAFTGRPRVNKNPIYTLEFVSNELETYVITVLTNSSVPSKLTLSHNGSLGRFSWTNTTQGWVFLSSPSADNCDRYALCGPYGTCDILQSPPCGCLKGFTAKTPTENLKTGCQRNIPLDCGVREGFRKYSSLKLPDTRQSWFNTSMTLKQCAAKCKKECNCTAYTMLDIKNRTGCILWYGDLIDMRTFPDSGQDVHIRMAALEIANDQKISTSKKNVNTIIIIVVFCVGLPILLGLCFLIVKKRKLDLKGQGRAIPLPEDNSDLDLPLFDMSTLVVATNNFSDDNKIGEGGFGLVYKGNLEDGREVAVKRLNKRSTQGVEEFKNEVIYTSKLQHRNLAKILGCSIQGEEKLLVYEWMPNKGLDSFLFRKTEKNLLSWSQRFHIINGVARGLLYLHQDSILRIIHRDLKPANILLDHNMNPKISDFGLARSLEEDESGTNTKRVAGTCGYISPEYAGSGIYSIKSDVYSFGVLVLEIVCGKKNRQFFGHDHSHNLLGHAWMLYKEGKSLELVDESLKDSYIACEVVRSICVALLCVQNNPKDRPDMSMVVMSLSSDSRLPEPRQPGFFTGDDHRFGPESSSSMQKKTSNKNFTITHLDPR